MKRTFFAAICIAFAVTVGFIACKQENNTETTYKGTVVNKLTSQPFPNLEVKVTDGEHINQTVHTDASGFFSLLVRFNEINSKYYLLVGDSSCVPVRKDFKGFGQKEIDLGIIEVEGPKAPTVTTTEPKDITAEGATVGGNVTDDGRATVTERGICYSEKQYPEVSDKHIVIGKGLGDFRDVLEGLESNTRYYVRAYAINRVGTSYGEQMSITTLSGLPVVETSLYSYGGIFDFNSSKFTSLNYTIQGNVSDNAGSEITARGVCYANQPLPTLENSSVVNTEPGTGYFSCVIEGITSYNLIYYIRAYATNTRGTSYGNQIEITPQMMKYHALPMLEYGGFRYKIYDMKARMPWQQAYNSCENLTFGGYNDWYLPEKEELQYILNVFEDPNIIKSYWSSSKDDKGYPYHVSVYSWNSTYRDLDSYYVLAVRKENVN